MPNNYDGYYPQYQFASGGLMQALSPNQAAYDPKFLQDSLLQKLFEEQTKQQILNAFTPGAGGSTGGGVPGGVSAPGGGLSFLEQLLASTAPVPASPPAPVPGTAPVPAPVPTTPVANKGKIMTQSGGPRNDALYYDRRLSR